MLRLLRRRVRTLRNWALIIAAGAGVNTLAQTNHNVTAEMVAAWMTELSNWGRWGPDDELGALNLITPQKRMQAAALVQSGVSVSLAHNYSKAASENPNPPFDHAMSGVNGQGAFVMDRISFSYHGGIHSHMDSLCHMSHNEKMYNDFSRGDVDEEGCQKLAITDVKEGIMTRGILLDIARLKGVDYLAPGTPIYVEDLEAWEERAGVTVQSGDIIFVRTGRWATPEGAGQGSAGLHASVAPWLKARDVAMVGGDYANDVIPSGVEGGTGLPIHQLTLVAMGVRLFDNLDLEALSAEAARQQRWEFLLTAAPIPVEGGTGSPLNPIATF
ncbi:MAG: cyclase family protein [Gammaproteobacteria bacterium]|nr:cyclase [Gammaproteobacteria bacterium]MDP6096087.1 cyclase family protein [Gammaproteobacteria bacterium]HJO12357.1 cyclase family protein [Gammaproteobacteria bacterium]